MVLSENYEIIFSLGFKKNYKHILYHLEEYYGFEYSKRFNSLLKEKLIILKENPFIYAIRFEYKSSHNINYEVRAFSLKYHLILYRVENKQIEIINIVSSFEDYRAKFMN